MAIERLGGQGPVGHIPQACRPVTTTRGKQRTIRREGNRENQVGMSEEGRSRLLRLNSSAPRWGDVS